MLVLFETSAGFALFKLLKDGRLDKPEVWRSVVLREGRKNEMPLSLFFSYFDGEEMATSSPRH